MYLKNGLNIAILMGNLPRRGTANKKMQNFCFSIDQESAWSEGLIKYPFKNSYIVNMNIFCKLLLVVCA
jgi:hypothetical protein